MIKKIVFGLALLMVLLAALGGSLKGRLNPLITMPPKEVTVCETLENRGIGNVVFDIQCPVVQGFDDKLFEQRLNKRILMQVENAKADALYQAKRDIDWVFVLRITDELKCNRGIMSLRVTNDLDNGGTGFPHTVYYNADIERSCCLTLDDLFVSREYRGAVDSLIRLQIENDEHFFAEDFNGVSECTSFFISDGQLNITFAKYEIASGMTGEPTFAIPTLLIRKWLKPEYASLFW
jgi:hypothetical protein